MAKVCFAINNFSFLNFMCIGILPASYVFTVCAYWVPTEVRREGLLDPLGWKLQIVESPCVLRTKLGFSARAASIPSQ